MHREFSFSSLIGQTFTEIGDNSRLALLYLAITVPLTAVSNYLTGGGGFAGGFDLGRSWQNGLDASSSAGTLVVILIGLATIVLYYWLYSGMARRTAELELGRFWPWIGMYLLSSLAVVLGLFLLIVPGIILLVRWTIVLPLVVEGRMSALDTMGESWERTRGHGWPIFGALVVLIIGVYMVSGVAVDLSFVLGGEGSIPGSILIAVASEVATIALVGFAVAAYRLLRDESEALTEVFE